MRKDLAVEFQDVGKMYRLYHSRRDNFLDVSGMGRFFPRWKPKIDHFWALRNITFKLPHGRRLGVIGRNGAGKSTLLKLITGNLAPTEGRVLVDGTVQALLEAGAGFHPEFTGYENVEASLIHNGFPPRDIKEAIEEIADFTELSDFMNQPFKSYSAGMQARLVFTTATTIKPDILIIDEILGAGDAYFAVKSRSRMKTLVESGASILLVSHALDQVVQFCDEALWIERGEIVARGPSLEVVKAYEEFIHALQDKQLKEVNRKHKLGFRDKAEVDHFADTFVVALTPTSGVLARISCVELLAGDTVQESVKVGGLQDSDSAHLAHVALGNGGWKDPANERGQYFREIAAVGELIFRSPGIDPGRKHSFRITYFSDAPLTLNASRNGQLIISGVALPGGGIWQDHEIEIPSDHVPEPAADRHADVMNPKMTVRRWAGEGRLMIEEVDLMDQNGQDRAVFQVGSAMNARIRYSARASDSFPLLTAIAIFRVDGVKVSQHLSPYHEVTLLEGEQSDVVLRFENLNLADGRYVISVALFSKLDPLYPDQAVRYDLVDRSYEFEVVGNPPLRTSLFVLPAVWDQ